MGYQDCPCFKCNHGGEREKRVECRRKCTEFTAWKLSMQAIRQKKKEDKDKYYSTTKGKFYKRNLMKQKVEERYGRSMQSLCRDKLHGHLCRSGAIQTRVPENDRTDKAADNKS